MSALKISNYRSIANEYAEAQGKLESIAVYYLNAAQEIANLDDFEPQLDLLQPFYNAYTAALGDFSDRLLAPMVQAVGAMNQHILDRGRANDGSTYLNIDEFIDAAGTNGVGSNIGRSNDGDGSFTVKTAFARLSSAAGYPIDSANIS